MPFGEGLTIKQRLLIAFSEPPALFAFNPHDPFKAVASGTAVLHITSEHAATLNCIGSKDEQHLRRNAYLLCRFLAVTGWEQGSEAWMTARLREMAQLKTSKEWTERQRNVRYRLGIDWASGQITLKASADGPVGGKI